MPPTLLTFLHDPDPSRLDAMLAADVRFHSPIRDYVGRADHDVKDKLLQLIGSGNLFKYRCSTSSEAAFHAECELFHDFQPPGNRMHPDRAAGTNWECPRCRFFRLQGRA